MAHDLAERWMGDLPYPAKYDFPSLGVGYKQNELYVDGILGLVEPLSQPESEWLAAVDMLEFALWCRDQWNLGNRHVRDPLFTAIEVLQNMVDKKRLPQPLHTVFFELIRPCLDGITSPERTSDFLSLTIKEATRRDASE